VTFGVILDTQVYGEPVPQPRAKTRLFRNPHSPLGVTASHYEPATAKAWKATVIAQIVTQKPASPVEGPLALSLRFYLPRPQSLPKREHFHVKRPDCDNLAKAVKDALKGVVYRDDSQIVQLTVTKEYGPAPGVGIRVERVFALQPPRQADLTAAASPQERR
jgi:Holliday junction resolvase RusA-like endonuclease